MLQSTTVLASVFLVHCTLIYKIVNNLVEVDLSKELIPLTGHFRNSQAKSYRIPYKKKTYLQNSFLPRTVKKWNSLPATLATAPSLNVFKSGVRELKHLEPSRT